MTVEPVRRLKGVYRPPSDKAIAHRALILSAMASGRSTVAPVSRALDVASTVSCLRRLGVGIDEHDDSWVIDSPGVDSWQPPERALDCGNSGTTMRLLAGVLAGRPFPSVLRGDASLSRRPMARIAEPLRLMGARLSLSKKNTPPIEIAGGPLHGIEYELPVPSAQVKSAILLAGLSAVGGVTVIEPMPSRDHTERMLAAAGVDCEVVHPPRPSGDPRERLLQGEDAFLDAPSRLRVRLGTRRAVAANDWCIPGDFSASAFVIVAALGMHKAELIIDGVGLNHTRTGLLRVMARMGAAVEVHRQSSTGGEPVGRIRVNAVPHLKPVKVAESEIPSLIDELPVLAVLAARAEGVSVIRGAAELRHKESDRIRAVAANLRAMGAKVAELEDGWAIEGPTNWRAATIDPCGDHRVAMAFTVAALWGDAPSRLEDAGVVAVSDPDFFANLIALTT